MASLTDVLYKKFKEQEGRKAQFKANKNLKNTAMGVFKNENELQKLIKNLKIIEINTYFRSIIDVIDLEDDKNIKDGYANHLNYTINFIHSKIKEIMKRKMDRLKSKYSSEKNENTRAQLRIQANQYNKIWKNWGKIMDRYQGEIERIVGKNVNLFLGSKGEEYDGSKIYQKKRNKLWKEEMNKKMPGVKYTKTHPIQGGKRRRRRTRKKRGGVLIVDGVDIALNPFDKNNLNQEAIGEYFRFKTLSNTGVVSQDIDGRLIGFTWDGRPSFMTPQFPGGQLLVGWEQFVGLKKYKADTDAEKYILEFLIGSPQQAGRRKKRTRKKKGGCKWDTFKGWMGCGTKKSNGATPLSYWQSKQTENRLISEEDLLKSIRRKRNIGFANNTNPTSLLFVDEDEEEDEDTKNLKFMEAGIGKRLNTKKDWGRGPVDAKTMEDLPFINKDKKDGGGRRKRTRKKKGGRKDKKKENKLHDEKEKTTIQYRELARQEARREIDRFRRLEREYRQELEKEKIEKIKKFTDLDSFSMGKEMMRHHRESEEVRKAYFKLMEIDEFLRTPRQDHEFIMVKLRYHNLRSVQDVYVKEWERKIKEKEIRKKSEDNNNNNNKDDESKEGGRRRKKSRRKKRRRKKRTKKR